VALEEIAVPAGRSAELLAIDEALTRLEAIDEQQARIVELRYFIGLSIEETASVLEISPATVKREWSLAKAFLRHAVAEGSGPE
jgi:RNA polymerase sigma factor (sigma-70 family)